MPTFPWSNEAEPPRKPTLGGHVWRLIRPRLASISFFLLVAIFAGVVFYPYAVVTVPSGEVGVLWKRFGGGTELDERKLLNEGLHVILPWDRVFNYNLRIQSKVETYKAISSDGVNLTAKVNNRFQLRRKFIPQLHQTIGPDYSSLLGPEIASRMREVISEYTAEQVYSTARQRI